MDSKNVVKKSIVNHYASNGILTASAVDPVVLYSGKVNIESHSEDRKGVLKNGNDGCRPDD